MDVILSIAGSDSCAGAGIQADIKAIAAHAAYGVTAVTAITAQNTRGVQATFAVPSALLLRQLESLFEDLPIAAVKTGMLATAAQVRCVATFLRAHPPRILVVDPVMIATSGDRLQEEDAVAALREELLPLSTVTTPNRAELAALTATQLQQTQEIAPAAQQLRQETGCAAVVVTGGDTTTTEVVDLLVVASGAYWIAAPRVDTPSTHGTGCTFSAALACLLAQGKALQQAVVEAKMYVASALQAALDLGNGRGASDHFAAMRQCAPLAKSQPTPRPWIITEELR